MVGLHFSVLVIMYYLCTIKQYDSIKFISDTDFNAEKDAMALNKAMKGLGTYEDEITDIIGCRSLVQRRKIVDMFKSSFGEDLEKRLESELSGHIRSAVLALMMPLPDFYAQELNHAMVGLGTQEDVLVEILCTLSNNDILAVADSYKRMYERKIEDDIKKDTSGHFRTLCVSLLVGNRVESSDVNEDTVREDAKALHFAGRLIWGTDESVFNRILVNRSYAHLKRVFEEYKKLSSEDIEESIKKEFMSDTRMGLLSIVRAIKHKEKYFAERLKSTMSGPGTNDRALIRIVVTRSEIDIEGIKLAFYKRFNKYLSETIEKDTSKDYKSILLKIIA